MPATRSLPLAFWIARGGERRREVEVAERGGRRGEHLPPVDPTSHERGLRNRCGNEWGMNPGCTKRVGTVNECKRAGRKGQRGNGVASRMLAMGRRWVGFPPSAAYNEATPADDSLRRAYTPTERRHASPYPRSGGRRRLLGLFMIPTTIQADEGMWLFNNPPRDATQGQVQLRAHRRVARPRAELSASGSTPAAPAASSRPTAW